MQYQLKFKRQAIKDFKILSPELKERILAKIVAMRDDLQGDVKKLTNFTPEYRVLPNLLCKNSKFFFDE